jgi:hypothetical protein
MPQRHEGAKDIKNYHRGSQRITELHKVDNVDLPFIEPLRLCVFVA